MNNTDTITTCLGDVLTIVFVNNAHNPPTYQCIVCQNREAYDRQMEQFASIPHSTILHAGLSRLAVCDGVR